MKIKGTLEIIKRLNDSRNGNPKFQAKIGSVTFVTETDSMLAYVMSEGSSYEAEVEYGTNKLPKLININLRRLRKYQ
jgi:hypothetical protein